MASPSRKPAPSSAKAPVIQLRKENFYVLVQDYLADVARRNRTPKTVLNYRQALEDFARFGRSKGITLNVKEITREHVNAYVDDMFKERHLAANSITKHIKVLRQFCNWCIEEGELQRSPAARVMPPMVPSEPPPVFTVDELQRLMATCERGRTFQEVRDYAVLRLLLSVGIRRGEMANIHCEDINWEERMVTVHGKGRRHRTLTYGRKADAAMRAYRRARDRREDAEDPHWWMGLQGPLGYHGLYLVVKRRAIQAGIYDHNNPHRFRHTAAHLWLKKSGGEGGLMKRMGWGSRSQLDRYGSSMAEERAREEYRRLTPDDEI